MGSLADSPRNNAGYTVESQYRADRGRAPLETAMLTKTIPLDRRSETRVESDDVIRWKRPGSIEDNKAWTIDRSPSGYGFMAKIDTAPKVGDRIHIRRFDSDRWDSLDEPFRVARTEAVTDELVLVGCVIDDRTLHV